MGQITIDDLRSRLDADHEAIKDAVVAASKQGYHDPDVDSLIGIVAVALIAIEAMIDGAETYVSDRKAGADLIELAKAVGLELGPRPGPDVSQELIANIVVIFKQVEGRLLQLEGLLGMG